MKLSWIFGNSIEAHHLLAAYVLVWLIQGGYAGWVAWQWKHVGKRPVDRHLADRHRVDQHLADKKL